MKSQHARRDLVLAVLLLLLASSACVYGFIKIVPLALAHSDAAADATSSSTR